MGQCISNPDIQNNTPELKKIILFCNGINDKLLHTLRRNNIYNPTITGINNLQCCINDCDIIIRKLNTYERINNAYETEITYFIYAIIALKTAVYELLIYRKRVTHQTHLFTLANIVSANIDKCNVFIIELNT